MKDDLTELARICLEHAKAAQTPKAAAALRPWRRTTSAELRRQVRARLRALIIAERVRAGLARVRVEGKRLGRPPIAADLEKAIRAALDKPGRTEGVRKIAARFGVDPTSVQKISINRPFGRASLAA
jgi:hypothetical protein